jgi:hypothetical protein
MSCSVSARNVSEWLMIFQAVLATEAYQLYRLKRS